MSKLFIFGIGGTGARVLRAFTHLCASGVKLHDTSTVIPIIIDPDSDNNDLDRTVKLINNYRRINKHTGGGAQRKGLFSTHFQSLGEYHNIKNSDEKISDDILLSFDILSSETFQDTLGIPFIDSKLTRDLLELIYTQEGLQKPLTHGYLGHPNIGSMLLHKMKESKEFNYFASNFVTGDRIFIISSIFGGTGAAGFPVLVKILRDRRSTLPSAAAMNSAVVGAVSIQPYFNVQADTSSNIDSSNFVTKTKAALAYYARNLGEVNSLYYLGDKAVPALYNNSDGGKTQRNNANLIELIAALSIFHFQSEGYQGGNSFNEYELKEETLEYNFKNLNSNIDDELSFRMTILYYLRYFLNRDHAVFTNNSWYKVHDMRNRLFNSRQYTPLQEVLTDYEEWLGELENNRRVFKPFLLRDGAGNPEEMYDLVTGYEKQKKFMNNFKVDDLSRAMNKNFNIGQNAEALAPFLAAFDQSAEDCISKFNIFNK